MNRALKEGIGIAVTLPRYLLAERAARKVKDGETIGVDMLGIVIADILDGEILRYFDADTPTRRIADGVVDHASKARVITEVAKKYPETRPYITAISIGAAAVGILNGIHLAKTGEITKGGNWQRAVNLSAAVFGVAAVRNEKKLTHVTGIIASAVALAAISAHSKEVGQVHEDGIRRV